MRVIPEQYRGAFDAAVSAQKALNANQEREKRAGIRHTTAEYTRLNGATDRAMRTLPGWLQTAAFHKAL